VTRVLTVEGDVTAANSRTTLNTQGSVASPNVKTPEGAKKLDTIRWVVGADMAADAKATVGWLILSGAGFPGAAPHTIMIVGIGGQLVQSGADPTALVGRGTLSGLDIEAKSDSNVKIEFDQSDDTGTLNVGATLIFT